MGAADAAGPLAHGLGHGILQRAGAAGNGDDLCAQKTHPVDVQRLTLGVLFCQGQIKLSL